MTSANFLTNNTNWQQQAERYLIQGNYSKAANLYEQAIAAEPAEKSHYWHLGLLLLLQGQEAEAQTTWLMAMMDGEPEQVELWTTELIKVIQTEAERREKIADHQVAWVIRQHIREIAPQNINNLLHSLQLSLKLKTFTGEDLNNSGIIELLQVKEAAVEPSLLLQVLQSLLNDALYEPSVLKFAEVSLRYAHEPEAFIDVLMLAAIKIAHSVRQPKLASRLAELCLWLNPKNPEVLMHLSAFYQDSHQYLKGIETAKRGYSLVETLPDKIFVTNMILRGLMSAAGHWEEAYSVLQQQQLLLNSILEECSTNLSPAHTLRLFFSTFFIPYFKDDLPNNRSIQNKVAHLCQENVQNYAGHLVRKTYQQSSKNLNIRAKRNLKIGYLSSCLRQHSVGWISRWIFQHHNREKFEIYAYMINQSKISDFSQQWFVDHAHRAYKYELSDIEAIEQIYKDEIDILVDLDSITFDGLCEFMTIKPAPIQVTWLGWDASGLPMVDYFIADPYVLPDYAQNYYSETILRLPKTYIAVDGFEVGVPTLRRDHLDISNDAVVYLSTQGGYKRHPNTVRLQIKILKEVPNSYFLIKGSADEESIKNFFKQIAEEEGVNCDRLRFLPEVASEEVHRANLGIADVVLDTYPYNGATTTLETLWMGIPLVTRVGQQFAARNSYTMMMNVGVTEGIAWTDDQYVEWGVRLGKDPALRQQIAWKLRQSRQTSPLWNAKQFTREMEKAYEHMWEKYSETGK